MKDGRKEGRKEEAEESIGTFPDVKIGCAPSAIAVVQTRAVKVVVAITALLLVLAAIAVATAAAAAVEIAKASQICLSCGLFTSALHEVSPNFFLFNLLSCLFFPHLRCFFKFSIVIHISILSVYLLP